MPDSARMLTQVVKRFLDFVFILSIAAVVIWPVLMLAFWLNLIGGVDEMRIETYLGFSLAQPDGAQLLHGKGDLDVVSASRYAWLLSYGTREVLSVISLFVVIQLRAVFKSLSDGGAVTAGDASRIGKVGFAIVAWHAIAPCLQYLGGRVVLADLESNVAGLQLHPALELDLIGVFTGLAVIVLSGVLLEAARIREEQALTI